MNMSETSSTSMKNAWDTVSSSYQKRYNIGVNNYYYGPFCPDEDQLQLLGSVAGKRVLEVGSGAGQNSIYLALKGAKAIAYDISAKQLGHGKTLAKKAGATVEFVEGAFEDLRGRFEPSSIDLVISSYAFQYHQSTESLHATFSEIHHILKPGGLVVISVDHPMKAIGYWNEQDKFIIDNYFDGNLKEWDYCFPETNIATRMRGRFFTINEYLSATIDSGLRLEKVLEPPAQDNNPSNNFGKQSVYGPNSPKDPFSYEHLKRIPGTLIIQARKV